MSYIRTKLSPPWVRFVRELEALFDSDPLIAFNVDYNAKEGPSVVLSIAEKAGDKATAIAKLLPPERYFGNVALKITVDGKFSNREFTSAKELFEAAFEGNPVFAYAVVPSQESWYPSITYIVFKNRVVQFFNDNLNDCHGLVSTLYEDIADDVFEEFLDDFTGGMVCFNTDVEVGKLGKPLGEWP